MSDLTTLNSTLSEIEQLRAEGKKNQIIQKQYSDMIFLLDCSISMGGMLHNGQTSIDNLVEAVNRLKIPHDKCVSFSSYCYEGVETVTHGGTDLLRAFQHIANRKMKEVVVISDGEPQNPSGCIAYAKKMGIPVHAIFIGNKGYAGEKFLEDLCRATEGSQLTVDGTADNLLKGVTLLLEGKKS